MSERDRSAAEYAGPRYAALREVSREVRACADAGAGTVVTRGYGPGRMVLGLAGSFRNDDGRLAEIERDLPRSAHVELVVELAALDVTDTATCRWLAAIRMRRLIAGGRVLLLVPRTDAGSHLRVDRPEEFVVIESSAPEPERPPAAAPRHRRAAPTRHLASVPAPHPVRTAHPGPGPGRRSAPTPSCPRPRG